MRIILVLLSIFLLPSCDFIKMKLYNKKDVIDESFIVESKSADKKSVNGKVRYKYPNGKLKSIVNYKDNKKIGVSQTFYASGEKQYEIPYKNGEKHGLIKWFYKSGQLYRLTQFENGVKNGKQFKYWESGKLKSEMLFDHNRMCSGLKEFTNTGKHRKMPQIIVKHENRLIESNKYHLNLSLNKKFRTVQFYIGELEEGKCLPLKVNSHLSTLETTKGKAIFKFTVPKGHTLNRDIPIVAVIKTPYQNHYILSTKVNVSVRNP